MDAAGARPRSSPQWRARLPRCRRGAWSCWYRHTTVAARILALLRRVPSAGAPPLSVGRLLRGRGDASLIASQYAVQAQRHSQTLQERLSEARREIDALSRAARACRRRSGPPLSPEPDAECVLRLEPDRARAGAPHFRGRAVQREGRARQPLRAESSRVFRDRAGAAGGRVRLPVGCLRRGGAVWRPGAADAPRGRQICTSAAPGAPPRRSARSSSTCCSSTTARCRSSPRRIPYFEVFRPVEGAAPREGTTGSEVDVAIYGWSLGAIYIAACGLADRRRAVRPHLRSGPRGPSGPRCRTNDGRYHVYFSNDRVVHLRDRVSRADAVRSSRPSRGADDALGAPSTSLVLIGTAMFTRVARARPRLGRALLREIRASFYRKLFLAFVLASIIPVLILALSHPLVLRQPADRRRRARGRAHRRRRAARHRTIERAHPAHRRRSRRRATTS